jgi:hypothetical protein
LRNGGGNLLHKAGISTLFGRFENGGQFHTSRLSCPSRPGELAPARIGSDRGSTRPENQWRASFNGR